MRLSEAPTGVCGAGPRSQDQGAGIREPGTRGLGVRTRRRDWGARGSVLATRSTRQLVGGRLAACCAAQTRSRRRRARAGRQAKEPAHRLPLQGT